MTYFCLWQLIVKTRRPWQGLCHLDDGHPSQQLEAKLNQALTSERIAPDFYVEMSLITTTRF